MTLSPMWFWWLHWMQPNSTKPRLRGAIFFWTVGGMREPTMMAEHGIHGGCSTGGMTPPTYNAWMLLGV